MDLESRMRKKVMLTATKADVVEAWIYNYRIAQFAESILLPDALTIAREYAEELEAENEKLKESMSGDRIEMAILKAENEKLKHELVSTTCKDWINDIKVMKAIDKQLAEARKDLFQEFESTIVSHVNLFCAEEDSEIQKFAEALLKALDSGKKQYGIEPQQPSKQQQFEVKE